MKGEWNTETKIETQNHLLSIYSEINYFIKIAADSFSLLPIKIKGIIWFPHDGYHDITIEEKRLFEKVN